VSFFLIPDSKAKARDSGNVSRPIARTIDITEVDFSTKRGGSHPMLLHKPLADKQSGGTTIHHSRHRSAPVPAKNKDVDFEV
jgi:hypothetical protein